MKTLPINAPQKYPTTFFGKYLIPNSGKPMDCFVQLPIEWIVLKTDFEEGKALLLSKYALDWEGFADCPLASTGYETSWKRSYLRKWLNADFFNSCFNKEEQAMIKHVVINSGYEEQEKTIDRIFLLSEQEVNEFFPAPFTAQTYEVMVYYGYGEEDCPVELGYEPCCWWTRTSGETADLVVCVERDGSLCEMDSNSNEITIRPAMWIKL